ncbi:MAG: hypothetical protein Tsb005_03070 [Gammaproteobacteria bacterium]
MIEKNKTPEEVDINEIEDLCSIYAQDKKKRLQPPQTQDLPGIQQKM